MKRTIAAITLFTMGAAIVGCETAPAEEAAPAAPAASGPTVEEIEAARQEAARTLSAENADLAIWASEPLSLPPAAPAPIESSGDIEIQQQAISWSCRVAFYALPAWWAGVFALQGLKGAGVLKDVNQCNRILGGPAALHGFLLNVNRLWQYGAVSFLMGFAGRCACDYVF